jgi:hypothetical protein
MTSQDRRNIYDGYAADHLSRNHVNPTNDLSDVVRHLGLEGSNDNVLATSVAPTAFVEQLERLTNARRVSKKDLELAALGGARLGLDLAQ